MAGLDASIHVRVHRMTEEARYEFIHQVLAHPSDKRLRILHKHIDGIGKPLKGNAFRQCASCFNGKVKRTLGNRVPCNHFANQVDFSQWCSGDFDHSGIEDYIDYLDLVSPISVNGELRNAEQFHMDYGYARGKMHDEDKSRIYTSIDGYRSYLLIIDRKSRHVWINLAKTKQPPITFINRFF